MINVSDVNKDLTCKAKAKAKDLTCKAKAKAKDLSFKAKAKAKDLTFKVKPRLTWQGNNIGVYASYIGLFQKSELFVVRRLIKCFFF